MASEIEQHDFASEVFQTEMPAVEVVALEFGRGLAYRDGDTDGCKGSGER